ncbi:hypothetical protein [Rhizobium sp. BR 249]|uniref:hypothetical protein n=1 Tax=Rhizobium sp. BR 249 TaxID=3040011 RepID=UPI0039BFDAE3
MLRILTGFFSLLYLSCLASPALAADKFCQQRETILAFSDIVLNGHDALPPAAVDKYGPEAAYLKIRYAGLGDEETRILLAAVLQRSPISQAADDLVSAWYLHRFGHKAFRGAASAEKFDEMMSGLRISGIRALLLDGGEDLLTKRLAAFPFIPLDTTAGAFTKGGGVISASIVDQSDEFKEKIVRTAEANGVPDIANYLAASENDLSAWGRFIARGSTKGSKVRPDFDANFARAMVGHPRVSGKSPEQEQLQHIFIGMAFEPEESFLESVTVVDGEYKIGALVAQRLTQQIQSGAIQRSGTMDAGWLFGYRTAIDLAGRSQIETNLEKRAYYGNRYVRTSGAFTVRDVIDRLLAVEALQPYVTGKADAVPPRPEDLSNKINWPRWTEMATKVRDDAISPILVADLETFGIVTELLFAKGDQEALRAFIRQAPSGEARLSVANDFAMRLDRACAAYLYHPGEAFTLNGRPIFKFDTE